jgi:hypothetical protein
MGNNYNYYLNANSHPNVMQQSASSGGTNLYPQMPYQDLRETLTTSKDRIKRNVHPPYILRFFPSH